MLQWERISNSETFRLKVYGGWIVKIIENTSVYVLDDKPTSSAVFVPDPDHVWTIEKEVQNYTSYVDVLTKKMSNKA